MRIIAGVVVAGILAGTVRAGEPAPINPYNGMQEREEKFEFAQKPAVKKEGDPSTGSGQGKWVITFAAAANCDATVAIVGPDGPSTSSTSSGQAGSGQAKIVRHLASGVLGKNAPYPFQQNSLSQKIEWDGKDDAGKPAPAGCKVKVSLGLGARFDKFDRQFLFMTPKALAVDKDGHLYYTTHDGNAGPGVQVFDRQGKYVRTLYPPPSMVPPDKLSSIAWNKTTKGEQVPRRTRYGGGWEFPFDKPVDFFTRMQEHTPVVTPDGRLGLLNGVCYGVNVARLLLLDTGTGACPEGGVVELGKTRSAGLAASPDGQWLYFAGMGQRAGGGAPNHAVLRAPLGKPGALEPFAGEVEKSGNDNAHFDGPEGVACDKYGNVYVGDTGNKRIQVFKPDGGFLKTAPDINGAFVLHPKTGTIYVLETQRSGRPFVITKLGGLDKPGKVAEMVLAPPKGCDTSKGSMMAVDPTSEPPALWFFGSFRGRVATLPLVVRIEDRGDKLVQVADALAANGLSNETGEGSPGQIGERLHYYLGADKRTGKLAPDDASLITVVGPDGLYYSEPDAITELSSYIVRWDPNKDEYVPFENGKPACLWGSKTPTLHKGKPIIGIPLAYGGGGPHHFQDPFGVAPNGDIYVPCYTRAAHAEMEKAGVKPPVKGQNVVCDNLWVFGPDGKVKAVSALPGMTMSDGVRIGRNGAVYVVLGFKPMERKVPDGLDAGSTYEDSRWGTLVKFNSAFDKFPAGRVVGYWEDKDADNPTHSFGAKGRKVRVENAHWSYGGISPVTTNYGTCTCLKSSFDLDGYERSFVPAAQTCTMNVLDANGNVVARLGGYGNLDSRGENSPVLDPKTGELRPRRPDDPKDLKSPVRPLGFTLPRSVAVTDEAMWVHDAGNRAVVRAALFYATEETVPLP